MFIASEIVIDLTRADRSETVIQFSGESLEAASEFARSRSALKPEHWFTSDGVWWGRDADGTTTKWIVESS